MRTLLLTIILIALSFDSNAESATERRCLTFSWKELASKLSDKTISPMWRDECGQSIASLHMLFGSENDAVEYLKYAKKRGIPIAKIGLSIVDAASKNYQNVTRTLLKFGVSPEASFKGGYSPLMYAAIGENLEIMRMLLKSGANINYEAYKDENAFVVSLKHGKMYSTALLLDYGVDVDKYKRTQYQNLLFSLIFEGGNPRLVDLLVKQGFGLNVPDEKGNTPLFYAVHQSVSREMMQALFRNGADRCFRNMQSETPTDIYQKLIKQGDVGSKEYYDFFEDTCR